MIILIGYGILPGMCKEIYANDGCWSDVEVVSTESTREAYRAILAVDGNGTVHIAWKDRTNYGDSGSDWDVFYKKKPYDGNWTTTEVVSTESTENCICLFLAVDGNGTVHIAWKDRTNYGDSGSDWDVFYKKKPYDGNWTTTEVVSTESASNSSCPSLAVENNGTVHVAWADGTNYNDSGSDWDVFYKKKPYDGNWTTTEVVSTESTSQSFRPSLAVDNNGTVHIAWEENTDLGDSGGDYDIFYKNKPYDDNWTTTEVVSMESTSNSLNPHLVAEVNGTVHVVWIDKTNYSNSKGDYDIFYKNKPYDDNWTTTEVVSTESMKNCNWPSLAVDNNGTVHVAWNDATSHDDSGDDYDIFYKKKSHNGNWTTTEVVSTESKNDSYWSSLAVDTNGTVHISWWDDEGEGHWVTYYKQKYCENGKTENETNDNSTEDDSKKEIPGFDFIIIICAMLLFFTFEQKRNA